MKYSIRRQFAYIFIGLMAGTILLCWFINNTFLEKYYIQNKQEVLLEAYDFITEANNKDSILTDEFDIKMQKMSNKYNISILVVDANSKAIKSTNNNVKFLTEQLLDNFFYEKQPNDKILEENNNYIIQTTMNSRTRTEFLEMYGILENGNLFLIQSPLEGIRDSVLIANRFLAYIGIAAVILCGIIIYFVSRKITEPILNLAEISKKMANLDFEARYQSDSKTEIALLGENINQLSETLEKTISELKTANTELRHDIEIKVQIDEMRKEFLSNVSHELKTPIALIQGYAEGLLEGIHDDEESKEYYCEVIVDEASKMNEMVKKLLELNRLEFGQNMVNMERINVVDLIRNTVQSLDILLKQNEAAVRLEVPENCFVWTDEFQTEEVLRNFLTNAINHAAEEKIIVVKMTETESKVCISIFNTGLPIPEEALPYIWDKFYKVDKARTRAYGGSGVGLSIVKAIMETLGHPYGVKNYTNGVEFWFELSKE